jgi:succinate dehydrogenase/fumarate reductase flavoprotein subunit
MTNINPKWGDWAKAPDPIPQEKIQRTLTADVLIIGAGFAGVTCALRAAQQGARVIVLGKSSNWSGRGGNIGVVNSSYLKSRGYINDPEAVAREWIKLCGNRCDEKLLWLYLNNGEKAMDWLVEMVTRPEYGAVPALKGCMYKGETYREIVASHTFLGGPMARKGNPQCAAEAVYVMHNEAVRLGAKFLFSTPAEQLIRENRRVTGAVAHDADGYLKIEARHGVVLATGDIGGNDEMCADLAPMANSCATKVYWPKDGNKGDGHRMGLWAGGSFEDTPFPTIMHPQAYHYAQFCFLFVKPDGTRFMNEDNYVQGKAVKIITEHLTYAWAIADSDWAVKVPPTLKYGGGMFWGQDCLLGESDFSIEWEEKNFKRGIDCGYVVVADTPEELAEKMNVPIAVFTAAFQRYNELAALGKDEDFGKRKELLLPLDKPPYYGMKFGPALLAVVGGLRVDTDMRVLDEKSEPVPGLYALGNTAGGRYGVDYPIHVAGNSLGTALTYGYLLGESLGNACAAEKQDMTD